MTTSKKQSAAPKKATRSSSADTKELKTDFPMSEKDEVKSAEQRINKVTKK